MNKSQKHKAHFKVLIGKSLVSDYEDDDGLAHLVDTKSNLRKDASNILFLMFLYLLQGVPLGLATSLPFILSAKRSSYAHQSIFSLSAWPFSLKLLWAPIVDSVFFKRIGRRKSWLVPMQYLIGIFMLAFANYVHKLLEANSGPRDKGKTLPYSLSPPALFVFV
jgi:glucan phosphoethanolaminetransferase (alkaline phosphatase superfamily)